MDKKQIFAEVESQKLWQEKHLKIKIGFDPTAPNLHLGHFVLLNLARKLQDMGHTICLLVGDFTAGIGDPTGKNQARPPLSDEQIDHNAKTYLHQALMVLKKENLEIVHNKDWLGKISPQEFIKLLASQTIQQLMTRDDFKTRFKNNSPIFMHEMVYPIMQGYDSVVLKADVELGGQDQWFNLLMGRELQKHFNQKQQAIATVPLLLGLDGQNKMSKSLANDIGFLDEPYDKFGKTMSISDSTMDNWLNNLGLFDEVELKALKSSLKNGENPKNIKMKLAEKIVEFFHGLAVAEECKNRFDNQFRKKDLHTMLNEATTCKIQIDENTTLSKLLVKIGFASSNADGLRKIEQGGVKINQEKVLKNMTFPDLVIGNDFLLQVGKKDIAHLKITTPTIISKPKI